MKKIIKLILLSLSLFLLTACLEEIETSNYISNNAYESKIIEATNEVDRNTIAILNDDVVVGSAIVIKEERQGLNYLYYAVTLLDNIKNENIKLYINNIYNDVELVSKFENETYNLGIITFQLNRQIKVTKILTDENEIKAIFVGQSILSVGSDSRLENVNNTKIGTISSINEVENMFTHDAATNHGELGSGVYDLDGYLVGLNVYKTYFKANQTGQENILGLNHAISAKLIANILNNIEDLEEGLISDVIFNDNINLSNYEETEYEKAINQIYLDANDSVVRINHNEIIYSGIIVRKENNDYDILTTHFDNIFDLKVIVNNKEYSVSNIESIDEKEFVSKLTIRTTDELSVYSKNPFITNKFETLVEGQTIISIGSFDNNLTNLLNKGTVSKKSYLEDYLFMHDIKLNAGQVGSPIFNLNGSLIGIYTNKINSIPTRDSFVMVAEGLGFGYNLSNLSEEFELSDYISTNEYEKAIIDVVNKVSDQAVTVKTNTGHGSGVIFKKETYQGQYRYYVLTNEHVINQASEISVYFSDDRSPKRVNDFQTSPSHDMAVLRFITEENFNVIDSKVMNYDEKRGFKPGQTVIAIGTPENVDKFNYVTSGILKNNVTNYDGITNLGINHDAALNPGNSGGPLFDLKGNLIGINVAKGTTYNTSEGQVFSERLSISLNINTLSNVFNTKFKIISYSKVPEHAPRLGITVSEFNEFKELNPHLLPFLPEADKGIIVVDIDQLYDAYGKVERFDVIVEMNGVAIVNIDDVAKLMENAKFGDKHILKIARVGEVELIEIEIILI